MNNKKLEGVSWQDMMADAKTSLKGAQSTLNRLICLNSQTNALCNPCDICVKYCQDKRSVVCLMYICFIAE
jgi:hypothetical protein